MNKTTMNRAARRAAFFAANPEKVRANAPVDPAVFHYHAHCRWSEGFESYIWSVVATVNEDSTGRRWQHRQTFASESLVAPQEVAALLDKVEHAQVNPIGNPLWDEVEGVSIAINLGNCDDGFMEFMEQNDTIDD